MTPDERARAVLRRMRYLRQHNQAVTERDWLREIAGEIERALETSKDRKREVA